MEVLRKHPKAFEYSFNDFKGVSSSLVMHIIPIVEDAELVVDTQRRFHPRMKDVVRK
jgi:hypothetical protein